MSDFGTMKSRIADEINRNDLTTQIERAVLSAIAFYETKPLYFNEKRATRDTVQDQEFYGLPTDFQEMVILRLLVNSRFYTLIPKTYQYITEINWGGATFTGYPWFYAIYNSQLRMYPIPNGVYTMNMSYRYQLEALVNATDTNAWMTKAEELIRTRAKIDLYETVIRGREAIGEARVLRARETIVWANIKGASNRRMDSIADIRSHFY